MKKKYSTKRALIASVLALCMCFSMLVGTTFAWFTDSVTSSGNIIKSGSLEIALEKWNGTKWEDASTGPIFNYDKWEPGYTQVVNLRVRNLGTLALKWQAVITTEKNLSILADVINVYVRSGKVEADVKVPTDARISDFDAGNFTKYTLREFINSVGSINKGNLKEKNESDYLGIVLAMDTAAGNEYQNLDLGGKFNLTILATQDTVENDSFDEKYDANAEFSLLTYGLWNVADGTNAVGDYEIPLNNIKGVKWGSATVPPSAVDANASVLSALIMQTKTNPDVVVNSDQGATTYEVVVTGLVDGNTTHVRVKTTIPAGLTGVELWHKDVKMSDEYWEYDSISGDIWFESATFSPFTIVYDAVPEVEEDDDTTTEEPTEKLPEAIITDISKVYANVPIDWNVAPANGNSLEVVYSFAAPHDSTTVQESMYKNWECDFFVKCDTDVPAEAIVLGGNYGEYYWIGFNNPEAVAANKALPLIGSVAEPWTYADVVDIVKEFKCGVAHVSPALDGATFTVMLRLTNPEDATEYYDIATINHTFPKTASASNATELDAAIADGATSIVLGAGTYKVPSALSGKEITIAGTADTKIDVTNGLNYINGSKITFAGVTIQSKAGTGYDYGFADAEYGIFNNCVIEGSIGLDYSCEFNNCTFNVSGNAYNVWTWGAGTATFNGCTFNCDGKAMLVYANVLDNGTAHQTVNINGCKFYDKGDDTVTGKAAIEITNTYNNPIRTYDVIINDITVEGFSQTVPGAGDFNAAYGSVAGSDIGTNVWGNKCELPNTQINVEIDGVDVY